ncbi:MAG TPA: hypothetical protein ENJ41_00440 [Oceanospirillales bacterium]|nr:hypothetical protein [Oceanospirillales bacterium]
MKLIQNHNDDINLIKTITADNIIINDNVIKQSCMVKTDGIFTDLELPNIDRLDTKHIDLLLSVEPEIIILGSGEFHTFPTVSILKPLASNDTGFEVMNNRSAARTYNILATEGRKVVCLLIIDSL